MPNIIIDSEKIKVYECVKEICDSFRKSDEWIEDFWIRMLSNKGVYKEFLHYLEKQEFLCEYKIEGYSIVDIFVWELDHYNLLMDMGKNDGRCNKLEMLLEAFDFMTKMDLDKEKYIKRLQNGQGMDK